MGTVATYKLIQDIEAEDHILGPLSFRQFVFGLIAAFLGYICFLLIVKHVAFLLVIFAPPMFFCAFFAFPWGGDQPTETWALAKLRFWFKPRRRIWDQSGMKEVVEITVPKKVEPVYTDGLSQTEVKSRLQALANTIDSRGWAIKHINAIGYMPQQSSGERLIDIPVVPPAPQIDGMPADDIMDAAHNPVAQQFQSMIEESSQQRRQRLMEELRKPLPEGADGGVAQPAAQWFINHNPVPATPVPAATPVTAPTAQPAAATPAAAPAVNPSYSALPATAAPDDPALSSQLKSQATQPVAYSNLRTLQPLNSRANATPVNGPAAAPSGAAQNDTSGPMTASGDPAILTLSKNNDLNVATLAREAQRAKGESQDEVVISLH